MAMNENIKALLASGVNPFACLVKKVVDGVLESVLYRQYFMGEHHWQ